MNKTLFKDSIREIKNTFKRFLSILLIVLLGVGFFAGLRAASPDMKDTVDTYYDSQNVMDIEVISTLGLTYEDIKALEMVEDVKKVVPTYSFDATLNNGEKEFVVKIESMPEGVNELKLIDGKMPENPDECVVERRFLSGTNYKIGDYITINAEKMDSSIMSENEENTVKTEKIKIVGTVESPLYMSSSRGTSKLGAGSVDFYMYMPKENININIYTIAYVTVDGASELKTYNEDYEKIVEEVKQKVEDISEERKKARYESIVGDATKKLEDSQAETKIEEAQEKLNDARTQISKIEKPKWYILDRNSNYGYAEYIQDTDRIANLAKVFPVVFFLVAALISLTSMSRMIEEQRVQIGTLKAIGYNKLQISMKYIIYAFLATVIGGVVGMVIGFKLIPYIITTMYGMMYTLPKADCIIRLDIGIMGIILALISTIGATVYTCTKELIEKPATLMLPKAPKPGKRIFLEKIPFIWKRLKFTQKVTARNLFRYKKKFLMTIIGVAGCTSLIIAGFGIRNAIGNMIPNQYGKIFKYNGVVEFKDDATLQKINEENDKVKSQEKIEDTLLCYMKTVEITNIENAQTLNLIVTDDVNNFSKFIKLQSRTKRKEQYTIEKDSVIISEKIATLLKINVGDIITIKNTDDIEKEVKVGAITENYLYNYMYMSNELYNNLYGDGSYKPNSILLKEVEETTIEDEDKIGKEILSDEEVVSGVSFLAATKDIFSMVMDKMQLVVYILIIAAGLLAFAVLYNLSNVTISERIRELATIKVLGFYNNEVFNYVTKETRILTAIGIIFGLFGGYFLSMYAVKTCELDMFMFNYDIGVMSFIYGIVITMIFAEIVNIAVNNTLKKISMIESLKSVD